MVKNSEKQKCNRSHERKDQVRLKSRITDKKGSREVRSTQHTKTSSIAKTQKAQKILIKQDIRGVVKSKKDNRPSEEAKQAYDKSGIAMRRATKGKMSQLNKRSQDSIEEMQQKHVNISHEREVPLSVNQEISFSEEAELI